MPIDLEDFELSAETMKLIQAEQRQTIFLARDSLRLGWVAEFRDGLTIFDKLAPPIHGALLRAKIAGEPKYHAGGWPDPKKP